MNDWLKEALIDLIVFLTMILAAAGIAKFMTGYNARAAEITYADIEYKYFEKQSRFPEMPNYKAKEGLALNFNTRVFGPVYWNNRIHAMTDPGQYRLIGWQFEFGLTPLFFLNHKLAQSLQVYYAHHSQHILEGQHPFMKFPVDNSLGLRWVILDNR